ncbi:MAG: PA14 domain-containing protein [Planctomycetota bacterium]
MVKKFIILTSFVLVLGLLGGAYGQGTGEIMREVWEDIGGTNVSDLTNNAAYPDSPTYGDLITLFETPTDFADNFGSRVYGWLHPETSGDYTFWIATDDSSDLWLSTSDSSADAVVIAGVDGWCPARAFDGDQGSPGTRQMSAPIPLVGGQKYYIQAIYKEGGGGDNLAVAWEGPDSPARSVIEGRFLSPAPWNIGLLRAGNPNPADGAVDADTTALEWAAGMTSVSYKVYLSADATIDEADLVGETQLTIQVVILEPGTTYYWRVDAVEADGTVIEGVVWSFSTLPLAAHFPSPADGATDVESGTKLSWAAGKGVIMHDMYFGTDQAAVAAADPSTFKGKLFAATYDPGPLELFTTYYWRVDEFSVTGTNAGPVWSFATPQYIIITADETALNYDNTAEPYVSELSFDTPADLTFGGLADVTLKFKGAPGNLSFDEATGTYDIAGAGADVWGTADQFHYVYRELTGDATMIARVVSNGTGSNNWAKGGVMIRQSLAAGSQHGLMAITGSEGGGGAFQWRPAADGSSSSAHNTAAGMAPGYWVKLDRVGNAISGSYSADGVTWTQQGTAQTIDMTDPVLIGLFVTSHAAGQVRWYTFDNVSREGNISADDVSADIASVSGNTPAPIYVALEDSAGTVGVAVHPDPAATMINQWWKWKIPLSEFSDMGVDVTNAAKLYFGVGDGQPGGAGAITVDDILVVHPVVISEPADVTAPGDNLLGVPNDGDWPGAETPPLAIDDNSGTKYLHFKGEVEPTGFVVEPMAGPTVVTGLTFTTANDSAPRDPVTFELYGSNETINGAYELIAAGDIVDFAGEVAWPRFTMNATPISFENTVAYKYYKVMFPTVRDPASANSMQIAEVELIGTNVGGGAAGPQIVWVSGAHDYDADGLNDDFMWVDLLEAEGYTVDYQPGNWTELDDDKIATLNAADLVIIARTTNSGDYNNGDEPTQWNSITAPMLSSSTHLVRSSRWKWFDSTSIVGLTPEMVLADGTVVQAIDATVGTSSFIDAAPGNGTVLATGDGLPWIVEWEAGVEFYAGAGQFAGGPRMFFVAGTQEVVGGADWGELNLTPDGITVFLNAVTKMMTPPPLISSVVRSGGVSGDRAPVGPYDGSTAPLATEPGGLMDGNMVYSDRTYPWFGVPAEYVGSEYIRTFNSDKNGGTVDVTYEVTISRPAIVWITVDDRIPAEWDGGGTITSPQDAADRVTAAFAAAGTFTDTGIDLYVHENDTTDRQMSVFAAELSAGTYVFGSMDSGKNFYNIGAVE